MFFMDDKNKALGSILGSASDGKVQEKKPESDKDEAALVAADELKEAVHSGDAKGILEAFKALFAHCESEYGEGEEG